MAFYLRGTHLPHRKSTADTEATEFKTPSSVTIPMSMHIGKPAVPKVKAGDSVKVGTLIGEQDGSISSPVYSSVSGKISKVIDITLSNGAKAPAVVIVPDGLMTPDEAITPPTINSREEFVDALKASGIVGLGGAGFPTYVKFNVDPERVDEIIINGAECEPYITSDSDTMINRVDDIKLGLELIDKFYAPKHIIIGIEGNKKSAIASMRKLASDNPKISVTVLPPVYPQGGEKVLVYHTTKKVVPEGKLPIDVGCIVCNCTTVAAIGGYAKTGMPLVKKCVTVDGGAVKKPQNVIAPIGTPISELIEFCGGFTKAPYKLMYGGPMMGITIPDVNAPIMKNTNAVLAITEKESKEAETTACIHCGSCANICPFGIDPAAVARAYGKNDIQSIIKLGIGLCMECGCCSYVCPAHIPLVQKNKLAKAALKKDAAKEDKKQ